MTSRLRIFLEMVLRKYTRVIHILLILTLYIILMQLFSFIILTYGCTKQRNASLILNKLVIYFK